MLYIISTSKRNTYSAASCNGCFCWGSKEDLLHATKFIRTINLDIRGQSWNTEDEESGQNAQMMVDL